MKKRIFAILISMAMLLCVFGCGKKDEEATEAASTAVRDDVLKLVNADLPGIVADRDNAVNIYNSYFENGAGDAQEWIVKVRDEAIPAYDTYLNNLKGLSYESSEVQELLDLYIKSSEAQRAAMQSVVDGVSNVDASKLDEAQQSINDSKTYLSEYETKLTDLCSVNGITINGSFGSASMSDAVPDDAAEETTEE